LQQLLNGLPAAVVRELNQFAAKYQVVDYWFSVFARRQMGRNHGLEALRNGLLNFAAIADRIAKELRTVDRDPLVPQTRAEIFAVEDPLVFAALACRELGLVNPRSAIYDSLRTGRLSPSFAVMPSTTVCAPLGIADDAAKIYRAEQFPVRVPVTYFQGAEDGETDSDFAFAHFKSSRQGAGQILLLRHGGHSPGQELLSEPGPLRELQLGLLTKALRGQRIGPEDVQPFDARGDEHWDLTVAQP
jgi:proline iminopeptidase